MLKRIGVELKLIFNPCVQVDNDKYASKQGLFQLG